MKVLFFITIMFVCAELYPGLPIINSKTYWEEPTKFCGSRLTIEMSIICNGRYNEDISSELIIKIKRGIVDECCSVPCKRRFLKDNYCAPEPQISDPEIEVTTEAMPSAGKISPINYSLYYYPLIGRVLADFPKDFPIQ